jgi:orotate phosphoribosyltransferase
LTLAQADVPTSANPNGQTAAPSSSSGDGDVKLEEIIVTPQKKEERLRDVPMSVTALSGDQLNRTQSSRLEDYVGKVPGVSLMNAFGGLCSQVMIRDISSGSIAINSGSTTYIDETTYSLIGPFANSYISAPNLDPFDMQRIEVLRGPQGTLYGANALAGLMKYVTHAPDPAGFKSTVQAGISSVEDGRVGYDLHGMANLPLSSTTALRLVGYDNHYPGFIDDPSRDLKNANDARFSGGRASLLYQPADDFSLRLSALYQKRSWDDYPDVDVDPVDLDPIHGDLIQQKLISNNGHLTSELYSAAINWKTAIGDLISATSYYNLKPDAIFEYTQLNGAVAGILGGDYGLAIEFLQPVHAVTQEIRLSSSSEQPLQWQVGGFFNDMHADEFEGFLPIDATTGEVIRDSPVNLGEFHIGSSANATVRAMRSRGIPAESGEPLFLYRTDAELKEHHAYKAAKAGDGVAAAELILDVAAPLLGKLRHLARDTIFIAPHALEASGENAIPQMLATYLALGLDARDDTYVVQRNKVYHTGADAMQRLITPSEFAGEVERGRRYVMVDDVSTMGGTLADLASYLQRNQALVIGSVLLVNAARSGRVIPDASTLQQLERRFGDDIRNLFQIEIAALTYEEARYLIGFRTVDEIRNRAAAAKQARIERLRSKGIQLEEVGAGKASL